MSGGSWDYLYKRISDAADRLERHRLPLRRAFGQHLQLVAQAMHDIEWVDSYDMGPGDEVAAIQKVFDSAGQAEVNVLIEDAEQIIKRLTEIISDAKLIDGLNNER